MDEKVLFHESNLRFTACTERGCVLEMILVSPYLWYNQMRFEREQEKMCCNWRPSINSPEGAVDGHYF